MLKDTSAAAHADAVPAGPVVRSKRGSNFGETNPPPNDTRLNRNDERDDGKLTANSLCITACRLEQRPLAAQLAAP